MNKMNQPICRLAGAILLGLSAITAQADYSASVLAGSPVVYWPLSDKANVPAADIAANSGSLGAAASGYYVGAALHPVPGALAGSSDTAASLDGTAGTVVSIPYSSALNTTNFTVEAWLKPTVENPAGTLTCALSSGSFGDPRSGWLIYQSDTGWSFRMYNRNGLNVSVNITGGPAPVADTWHHIVAVYDGTTAKVYVNGVEAASGTPTGYVPSAGGGMFIGGRSDSSFWWNGAADEVAVYGTALSAGAIAAHYQNGTNATPSTPYNQVILADAPLGYYRLGEEAYVAGENPAAVNVGTLGVDYNGAYTPGVNSLATGPKAPTFSGFALDNTAAGFNGVSGFVGTPYRLNDLAAFSMMGWIKRGAIHSVRGGYFGQNNLLEMGDADGGANIEVYINAYGGNLKIPFPFRDDEWGHLAFIADGTGAAFYTNGILAASTKRAVDSFGSSDFNFNIGGGGIFNNTGDYFRGSIDEVAVFDRALTVAELQAIYFGADIAPVITSNPIAPTRTLVAGNVVTLSVGTYGTPVIKYQWRKAGEPIVGKTASSLVFPSIALTDAGTYDVIVSNDFGSVTSSIVTLNIGPADTVPPVVQYADAGRTFTTARIWFSDSLDPISAQTIANYSISDGTNALAIVSATLASPAGSTGDNMVDLVTAAQTPGVTYTVTINGVKDQTSPGNAVAANSKVSFTAWTLATGYLTFEHYDKLPGAAEADLLAGMQDPRVLASTPTTLGFLAGRFDSRTFFADDTHEEYLAKITGWITPEVTGEYYFFLRSDDASRLYLSADATLPDPTVLDPIAVETGCCGPFYEPEAGDAATTATPISLVAGQSYGILAYIKEGGGGDFIQVAWRATTDTTVATSLPYLPGQFLSTYVNPNTDLAITTQPTDVPGVLPSAVVDFVTIDFAAGEGGFTVIDTDPAPPGPFFYDAGTGAWVAEGGDDACGGPYNSKLTSATYTVPAADEVTLTFSHRYSFEADRWDGGQVWISVNGGAYTPVAATNFTANGYPPGVIQGNGVIKDQLAFHDNSPGYSEGTFITSSVILGSFAKDDTIAIQFVGAWDDCSGGLHPSWVIKNMILAYGTAPRASTFTVAGAATKQGVEAPFKIQWQRDDGAGFVDIANENAATFRIFPVAADFAARFRAVLSVPGKQVISAVVKLTGGTATPPDISIAKVAGVTTITYTGTLQSTATLPGTFSDVVGATSPYTVPAGTTKMFYRSAK
jgi:hypothetical protein